MALHLRSICRRQGPYLRSLKSLFLPGVDIPNTTSTISTTTFWKVVGIDKSVSLHIFLTPSSSPFPHSSHHPFSFPPEYFLFFFIHNRSMILLSFGLRITTESYFCYDFFLFWETPQWTYDFVIIFNPEHNGITLPLC